MADTTVDVEPNPARVDGVRAYVIAPPGIGFSTAYRGIIGGAILQAVMERRDGSFTPAVAIPSGFALGMLNGLGVPRVPDPNAKYEVICMDPNGSDANPWPTLESIKAAIE